MPASILEVAHFHSKGGPDHQASPILRVKVKKKNSELINTVKIQHLIKMGSRERLFPLCIKSYDSTKQFLDEISDSVLFLIRSAAEGPCHALQGQAESRMYNEHE